MSLDRVTGGMKVGAVLLFIVAAYLIFVNPCTSGLGPNCECDGLTCGSINASESENIHVVAGVSLVATAWLLWYFSGSLWLVQFRARRKK